MNYDNMTREELVDYINNLNENLNGKYGLVWDKEKEPEKIVSDCDKFIPTLNEVKEKIINNKGSNNLLIEGDNFHSLSVLNYTHNESVDVIYIDPPYNTGNDGFIYNDKFVDVEDGYRHSKWLNFMEKRLKIAKNLLKDNGTIFISIDDNEYSNLKLLCDKIFGEKAFIGNLIWLKKRKGSFLTKKIISLSEYILVYSKTSSSHVQLYGGKVDESGSQPIVKRTNAIGDLKFGSKTVITKLHDGVYKKGIYGEDVNPVELLNDIRVNNGIIDDEFTLRAHFTWSQSFLDQELKNGTKVVINTINMQPRVYRKYEEDDFKGFGSVINGVQISGTNEDAYEQLEKIFNKKKVFDYSKPVNLIKTLLDASTHFNKNATVLDFFAGSGTTGQAVLELNKEDGGNRNFIICTNNENNICEEITYPRIKTVITGVRNDKSKYSDGLFGSVRYYRTEFINNEGTRDQLYYNLTEKCIPMLCIKSDTYIKVESNNEYVIFTNEDKTKYSCVYFDIFGEKYKEFLEKIKGIKEQKQLYIFSLSEYVDEEPLKDIKNYSIEPIPYKILDLYKTIVKMSKE